MVFSTALFVPFCFGAYHVWGHFNWGFLGLCNQYFSVFILLSSLYVTCAFCMYEHVSPRFVFFTR